MGREQIQALGRQGSFPPGAVSLGKILPPNVMDSYFFNNGKDGEEMGTLSYRCFVNSPKKSHSKDAQHI